jgi:hypothetical protein
LSGGRGRVHFAVTDSSDVIATTEDQEFVEDPQPVVVTGLGNGASELAIEFSRPGAVVIRGSRIAAAS